MSWKNWSFHSDGDSSEFLKYEKPNYAFGGSCFLKKRYSISFLAFSFFFPKIKCFLFCVILHRDATEVTERFNSLGTVSLSFFELYVIANFTLILKKVGIASQIYDARKLFRIDISVFWKRFQETSRKRLTSVSANMKN